MLFVLRVVSRLQGDSLSDTRSEEEHRPHISEQAVPDISCKFHNTAQIQSSYYSFFFLFFYISVVSRSPLCCSSPPPPPVCVCVVWSSSIAWGGHSGGAVAGMRGLVSSVSLGKCPPKHPSPNNQDHFTAINYHVALSSSTSIVPGVNEKPPRASC